MIDGGDARRIGGGRRSAHEVDIGEGRLILRVEKEDLAAVDVADRRNVEFAGMGLHSDLAGAESFEPLHPPRQIVDEIADRAHARPVQQKARMGDAVLLLVEDHAGRAEPPQPDILGAVAMRLREAERGEDGDDAVAIRAEGGDLDESDGAQRIARRRLAILQQVEGAHPVRGDGGRRQAAHLVVVDFQRHGAGIPHRPEPPPQIAQRQIPLPREQAKIAREQLRVHADVGHVGEMHQGDAPRIEGVQRLEARPGEDGWAMLSTRPRLARSASFTMSQACPKCRTCRPVESAS